jgi:KaiC/GvpD/RAD55 family RecA-like ATPase
MTKPEENDKFEGFSTGIDALDAVLKGGIKCENQQGILGAIFGAAGTGKTTLGLQLCCRFLVEKKRNNESGNYSAIYITHENPEFIKKKLDDFDYFKAKSDKAAVSGAFKFEANSLEDLLNGYHLHVIQIPFEEEPQTAILQNLFDTVTQQKNPDPHGNVLVCIDSTGLIHSRVLLSAIGGKEAVTQDGERTDNLRNEEADQSIYKRLHQLCQEQGLHTFLVIEEDIPEGIDPERTDISSRQEVYAADIVIRMGIHTYEQGYRERFIQVIKAKNQFYYRGKHHCSIVSKYGGGRSGGKDNGVVIYPSIPMQLSLLRNEKSDKGRASGENVKFGLGIKDLDTKVEKIIGQKVGQGYIAYGTNSVLVSDLDVKATEIALHFAMNEKGQGLYISFLHKENTVREIANRFWDVEAEPFKSRIVIKDFSPEYISEHKLLKDIDELILDTQDKPTKKPLFVVLDNVFELQCKYPLIKDATSFLAALLELFSARKVTSLIVDTVEVGEGNNPIEQSKAAGLADNVFLLRHVEFHSRPHRVFSILKLVGEQTPDNLWDLVETTEQPGEPVKLEARDTFILYKNVLTGRPEPVTVTLSLYMDAKGSPFYEYLDGHITSLKQTFGDNLKVNFYGPEEYSKVQGFLSKTKDLPRGDCHIVALDEFWLKDLIRDKLLEELSGYESYKSEDKRYKYVCTAHDIALYKYIESQKDVLEEKKLVEHYEKRYAIPARNNCGVLCFDKKKVEKYFNKQPVVEKWLTDPIKQTISWGQMCELRKSFKEDSKEQPCTFFTFCMDLMESCVCFLLELALSYDIDKKRPFLYRDPKELSLRLDLKNFPSDALKIFVSLLDRKSLEQVASGRFRPSKDEPAALFSRQWMSTLGSLRMRTKRVGQKPSIGFKIVPDCDGYFQNLEPYPLPIGPKGQRTSVSGTWYLGILKGSTAVGTGVKLIEQFTSILDELHKLNNYVGFPVAKEFYDSDSYRLPYAERFKELAEVQRDFLNKPKTNDEKYRATMQAGHPDYLLYRVLIEHYPRLALILWRLMVSTAKEALAVNETSTTEYFSLNDVQLKKLIENAANEFNVLPEEET